MIKTAFAALTSISSLLALSQPVISIAAQLQPTNSYCVLTWANNKKRANRPIIMQGTCKFTQSQGSTYVENFNWYNFAFTSGDLGKTYKRKNHEDHVSFERYGNYTLRVFKKIPDGSTTN